LEVEIPDSQLIGATVFEDVSTAEAAVENIYAHMRDKGLLTGTHFGLSNNLALYADELLYFGDSSLPAFYFYNNTLQPTNSLITDYWNATYHQIYAANAVLEGLSYSPIPAEDSNRLEGEAYFIRATLHFYLVNLFGSIPYVTSTDHRINSTIEKNTVSEVYGKVIADLETAIALLPENYTSNGRTRPNKYTAMALMARVHLYKSSWIEAENWSNAVLNSAFYPDELDIDKIFKKESTETLWQLPPAIEGYNTHEATTFTILASPPQMTALSQSLVAAFSAEDLRLNTWVGAITDGTNTWYYPNKYKQLGIESVSAEYSIIFRKAEIYLTRAEARAHNGDLSGAKEDLNKIRMRSGLTEINTQSQQEILDSILMERKREFFTELGHRFFDLKRTGKLDEILAPFKPGWNTDDQLFPLPQTELSANPNLLPQNPGY